MFDRNQKLFYSLLSDYLLRMFWTYCAWYYRFSISKFWDQKSCLHCNVYRIPDQINADYLNSERHETSTHFRNKKSEYLKGKIISLKQTEQKC